MSIYKEGIMLGTLFLEERKIRLEQISLSLQEKGEITVYIKEEASTRFVIKKKSESYYIVSVNYVQESMAHFRRQCCCSISRAIGIINSALAGKDKEKLFRENMAG